jgi:hypothetical protein
MALRTQDYLEVTEESSVGTPSSGHLRVYAKTDGNLYYKDDGGTEYQVQGGSVIESIQRGISTTQGVDQNISISSVDMTKSFCIVEVGGVFATNNTMGSASAACGRLTSNTQLRFSHDLCVQAGNHTPQFTWKVIEFK